MEVKAAKIQKTTISFLVSPKPTKIILLLTTNLKDTIHLRLNQEVRQIEESMKWAEH
ncbi:MAG: hypothetical protein ACPGVB_01055 [Chitinophagales bacterium]